MIVWTAASVATANCLAVDTKSFVQRAVNRDLRVVGWTATAEQIMIDSSWHRLLNTLAAEARRYHSN